MPICSTGWKIAGMSDFFFQNWFSRYRLRLRFSSSRRKTQPFLLRFDFLDPSRHWPMNERALDFFRFVFFFSFCFFVFFLEWRAERKREGGKGRGNNNNNNKNNNNNNKTNNNNNNKKEGRKGRRAHKDARRSAAASGPGPAPRAPSVESRTRMTKHAPRSLDLTATWIFVLFFFLLSAPTGYDRAVYPRLSALSNVIDSEDFGTQKKKTNKKSSPTWKWPSDEIDLRPRGDRWPDEYGKLGTTR